MKTPSGKFRIVRETDRFFVNVVRTPIGTQYQVFDRTGEKPERLFTNWDIANACADADNGEWRAA